MFESIVDLAIFIFWNLCVFFNQLQRDGKQLMKTQKKIPEKMADRWIRWDQRPLRFFSFLVAIKALTLATLKKEKQRWSQHSFSIKENKEF